MAVMAPVLASFVHSLCVIPSHVRLGLVACFGQYNDRYCVIGRGLESAYELELASPLTVGPSGT